MSQLFDDGWQNLAIFSPFRGLSIELRTRPNIELLQALPVGCVGMPTMIATTLILEGFIVIVK
ncbi:hypothetical protein [Psychrobacter sp. VH5]|uniref:hypothetical protein n=1 Tax=Psychrobacter sp. VH5 TaxID=3423439 RepID=UPI003D65D682